MGRWVFWALLALGSASPARPQESDRRVRLRVAGAQIPVGRDVASNVAAIGRAIDFAAAEKADVLVTPEGSLSGYTHEFDREATARGLAEVLRRAREAKVALALGTCFEEEDGQAYDELRFYDKGGAFLGFHAKILLTRRLAGPARKGEEADSFKTRPLRTFALGGLTVGGLVCNDLWANPEWTPVDDPHLTGGLARMGAKVIFHSVNAGASEGEELALNRAFHDANLRLRARSGRLWIVTANAADSKGGRAGNAPSGVVDPAGKWLVQTEAKGERFFVAAIDVDP